MRIAPTSPAPPVALADLVDVERAAAPEPTVATPPAEAATREQVAQAVSRANRQMAAVAPSLQFEVDPDTRDVIIRLVDQQDRKVLRQVPAPEMLAIARALDRMQALLVRTRA